MYYLERGAQESNLEFAFNLQLYNPGDIVVHKDNVSADSGVNNAVLCKDTSSGQINEAEKFYYRVEVAHKATDGSYTKPMPYVQDTADYYYSSEAQQVIYDVIDADNKTVRQNVHPSKNGCI